MERNDIKNELMIEKWFSKAPTHRLDDIVGKEELVTRLKEEVNMQGVEFQKLNEIFSLPKTTTYFFCGEPGSGVGYAAKAFARELVDTGMVYMEANGSEFPSKYVGEGEKNISLLFENAKDREPVVLVIEEVEQICANRSNVNMGQYKHWLTNAFLYEYNRIRESKVTVIAVSNHPENVDEYLIDHAKCIRVDD